VIFLRAYLNLEGDFAEAGYTLDEIHTLETEKTRYLALRDTIKHASGEHLDIKAYEADMRQLLDMFVEAKPSEVISNFDNTPLLELIIRLGVHKAVETLPASIKKSEKAVAETISNNVRSKIIKSRLSDPAYFDQMSKLLDQLLRELREQRISYRDYLAKIAELAKKITSGRDESIPQSLNTAGLRALYNNLGQNEALALQVDGAIKGSRPDGWRGNTAKERRVQGAIFAVLKDEQQTLNVFEIIKQQGEY
jgi:type I restriction enzyme R subunit